MKRCRLCQKESDSIRNSHPFPEFLYRPSYDEKHRALYLDPRSDAGRRDLCQKGPRERMLCPACETHLSVFEGYGASVLRSLSDSDVDRRRPNTLLRIPDVDYVKFKIFTMSLLWRAGVSTQAMFRKVRLGPHEERLREMIVEIRPGEPWEYGCFLEQLQEVEEFGPILVFPGEMRLENHKGCYFLAWGLLWQFVVSSHASELPYEELFLTGNGQLPIKISDRKIRDFI